MTSSNASAPAVVVQTGTYVSYVAFDSKGNLWVSEPYAAHVVEYTPDQLSAGGTPTPAVTLSSTSGSINGPAGIAFDGSGNLWLANNGVSAACPMTGCGAGMNTIVEFKASQLAASGSPAPAVTLTANGTSISGPEELAFDHAGNLWLCNFATDAATGIASVVEFTAAQLTSSGKPTPAVTLTSNAGSMVYLYALGFDSNGDLWVDNAGNQELEKFPSSQLTSSGSPIPTVVLQLDVAALGFAFDGQGNLWWTGEQANKLSEIAAAQTSASGKPTPSVVLTGSAFAIPGAIAFAP
jgi:sugar lactone lactonase YvrE